MFALHPSVEVAMVGAIALVLAAAIPALMTYYGQKKNKALIEEIREQVLPGNGHKLHEYASRNREDVMELKEATADLKASLQNIAFDFQRHQFIYKHERNLLEEE